MNAIAISRLDVRAIFGEVITRCLDGDMKDTKNTKGRTYIEQFAYDMFLDPDKATKLTARARLPEIMPEIKASIERANAVNMSKRALLDLAARCKKRGPLERDPHYPPP